MNIQQLKYLTALAENETLTAAAHALAVSQPVISRELRRLEDELKAPILRRRGRRLCFTPEGKEILIAARLAVTAFDDVSKAASATIHESILKIGICHSTFVQIMSTLRILMARYPKLHIRTFHSSNVEEMLELLRKGVVDVCYGMESQAGSGVFFTPHTNVEVVLLSPPGTSLPATLDFLDLQDTPMICLLPGRERSQMIDKWCMEAGFRPNYVLECDDPSAFVEAVRSGIGSAIAWRRIGEMSPDLEMRCFDPPYMVPVGFYHGRKPAAQVRTLLALARQNKPVLGPLIKDIRAVPL